MPRKETDFRREVRQHAEAQGWRVHWEVDHRFKPTTGFPDLVLARTVTHPYQDGTLTRVLFRELKLDDTYLKATQDDWKRLLTSAGLDYDVWRPRDWPRIRQELQ